MSTESTTPTTPTASNLERLINSMAEDMRPIVQQIEASPAITCDHYGDYLGAIGVLSEGDPTLAKAVALAFVRAGANKAGVAAALRILGAM
jgi:hypothetical protein